MKARFLGLKTVVSKQGQRWIPNSVLLIALILRKEGSVSLTVQPMTAIWREGRQPNFDPFGRAVTPPNTPPSVSCCSNTPLHPQSFVWIWIPLLPPLGRSTEAVVCTYLALIPVIPTYHCAFSSGTTHKWSSSCRSWSPRLWARQVKGKRPHSSEYLGLLPRPPHHPIRNLQGGIIYRREFRNSQFLSFLPGKKGEPLISVFIAPRGGEE